MTHPSPTHAPQYTHILEQPPGRQLLPSLLYSKLDFFSLSLPFPPFSYPPFFSAGRSCLSQIQSLLPSWLLSQPLCSSLHLCLPTIISTPASFLCCPLSLTIPSPPFCVLPLLNILRLCSLSVPHSLLFLQISSLVAPLFFTLPFHTATSHPPFFPCAFFLSPFLFSRLLFSFTLGVKALWRLSVPQLDIQQGKEAEKRSVEQGQEGKAGRDGRKGARKMKRRKSRWRQLKGAPPRIHPSKMAGDHVMAAPLDGSSIHVVKSSTAFFKLILEPHFGIISLRVC